MINGNHFHRSRHQTGIRETKTQKPPARNPLPLIPLGTISGGAYNLEMEEGMKEKCSSWCGEAPCFCMEKDVPEWLLKIPFWMNWVYYKGEKCVTSVNYEKSIRAHRPIMDIHYCMTKALNNIVEKTVNWNPNHFKSAE